MRWAIVSMVVGLSVAGCAKAPSQIEAVSLPEGTYAGLTCQQLVKERQANTSALKEAETRQQQAREADIVGVMLLGIPIGSATGQDAEVEVATLKGKDEALAAAIARRGCLVPSAS